MILSIIQMGIYKWSGLFNIVKKLLKNFLFFSVRKIPTPLVKGSLLIVKLDNIGDYVLFRFMLKEIRNDSVFGNYKITLIGNSSFRDLAEEVDNQWIDRFIWVDKNRFSSNTWYKLNLFHQIRKYEILINPTHSRSEEYDDTIALYSNARMKIGMRADDSNMDIRKLHHSDNHYTEIIETGQDVLFEFYRYKIFAEKILKKKLNISKPVIELRVKEVNSIENAIVIFPGGTFESKKWSVRNYLLLAESLTNHTTKKIIFIGNQTESDIEPLIAAFCLSNNQAINLINKTNLVEILSLVSNASFIVGNESSVIHIAASMGTPFLCIANGHNFMRFSPYPPEIIPLESYIFPFKYVYPDITIAQKYKYTLEAVLNDFIFPDIYQISETDVMERIEKRDVL